jgi:hypothetical protein
MTNIKQFTAHPIDHAKAKATQTPIPNNGELNSYLATLIEWAYQEQDVRQFFFAEKTTEVHAALQNLIADDTLSPQADIIANRLLKKEKERLEEVEHLKGVHEGMLLQAIFTRDDAPGILLAKVDLSEFLGREDFRSRTGIDKKHRLLKICLIELSEKHGIQTVHVGDTNSTIAVYWWKDFLELTEKRTDSSNTKTAFAVFDTFLGKTLRKDYPRDYPILFNEVLRRFRRNQPFKARQFLNEVFDNYRPSHNNLDVPDLKRKAASLLDKDKFDANFTILPGEVEKRFKKTYTLTPQIEVTIDGELENLADQISGFALEDGTQGVFIKSDSGFKQFPPRQGIAARRAVTTGHATSKQFVASTDKATVKTGQ